jgi:hypothetical protein
MKDLVMTRTYNPTHKLYPRKCDITGEGMDSGFCIQDGSLYVKYETDMIVHLREVDALDQEWTLLSDEQMIEASYESGYHYFTDWEELDSDVNYTIDGVEVSHD